MIEKQDINGDLVVDLREKGRQARQAYFNLVYQLRDLRHSRHKVIIPERYATTALAVKNPVPWITAEYSVAAMTRQFPVINAEPAGISHKDEEAASLKERWTDAVLQRLQREAAEDVFTQLIDNAVNDGLGIAKLVYAPQHWSDYNQALVNGAIEIQELGENGAAVARKEISEEWLERTEGIKRRSKLPWLWRAIDPVTYLPWYDEDGLAMVIEFNNRPKQALWTRFRNETDKDGNLVWVEYGKPQPVQQAHFYGQYSEFTELWTRDFAVYVADGHIKVIENQQKRPPYFEIPGLTSADIRPERRYMSALYGMRDIAPALDALLTMHHNLSYLQAYPKMVKVRAVGASQLIEGIIPAEAEQGDKTRERWDAGDLWDMTDQPGVDIRYLVPPENPRLLQQIQIHEQLLREASPAEVFFGRAAGADEAGYAINQRLMQSKLPLNWIARNAAAGLSEMIEHLWWTVEHLVKDEVPLWGRLPRKEGEFKPRYSMIALGPKDLKGFYSNTVEITPIMPFERIQNGQFASQMYGAGAMTMRQFRETIGDRHPDETADERLIENWENSPEVQAALTRDALIKAGVIPAAPTEPTSGGPVNTAEFANLGGGGMPDEMNATPGLGRPVTDAFAPSRPAGGNGRAAGLPHQPGTPVEGA